LPASNPHSKNGSPIDITPKPNSDNQEKLQEMHSLLSSLNSDNHEERCNAIRLLGQQGPKAHDALPQLREALKDSNHNIRLEASIAIGFIGTQEEVPRLLPLLEDEIPIVRFQTISSLAFLRDPRATPVLIERFEKETTANRDQILRAIGHLGGPEAFKLLKHGITDKDPIIRLGAVVGFSFLLDPRAEPLLQNVADNDEDELISHEARIAISLLKNK
jgi:HEAT repeat protein